MAEVPREPLPIPRQIGFEFPDDLSPHWKPDDLEFCAMVNGASLTMPYLEPFLVKTVREAISQIDDARVKEEAKAFNTQEQFHYRAHRRFNELVKSKGYPELAELEGRLQASYGRLGQKSLRRRLAYTAGFEAMTMGVTRWLINNRVALFGGSDTRVASFILWHFVEESEHKLVAFDVYRAACGGGIAAYFARMIGVFNGSLDVMWYSMRGYKAILQKDGLWNRMRSRLRLAAHLWSFVRTVAPYLLRAALPGHNPRHERDPQWVQVDLEEPYLIDRVMGEASLYDEDLAALALAQTGGELYEAVLLLRAWRTTQPRLQVAAPIEQDTLFTHRRISAAFKDIPGGQVLGPTLDYAHRILATDVLQGAPYAPEPVEPATNPSPAYQPSVSA